MRSTLFAIPAVALSAMAILATPVAASPAATRVVAQAEASPPADDPKLHALAASLVGQAQRGEIDRSLFDSQANAALTPDLLKSVAAKIAPLGKPTAIRLVNRQTVDGTDVLAYRLTFPSMKLVELIALDASGKISGWRFSLDQPPATPTESSS